MLLGSSPKCSKNTVTDHKLSAATYSTSLKPLAFYSCGVVECSHLQYKPQTLGFLFMWSGGVQPPTVQASNPWLSIHVEWWSAATYSTSLKPLAFYSCGAVECSHLQYKPQTLGFLFMWSGGVQPPTVQASNPWLSIHVEWWSAATYSTSLKPLAFYSRGVVHDQGTYRNCCRLLGRLQ